MFGKLAVAIISTGFCACALLAARQMRTQAAYEMAQSRLRAVQIDDEVADARARISSHVSPEHVLQMASRLDSLKPLAVEIEPRLPATREVPRVAQNQTREHRR